ncbi:MAG TPA: flagellar protein FlgN [Methylophilus sp.]
MPSATLSQVTISFETDASLVAALLEDLQQEQNALVVADLDTIEAMLERRSGLLQSLAAAANQRYAALAAAGFAANEDGMADWLQQLADAGLTRDWVVFQQSLVKVRELNRLNGILIQKQFQRNQEKLDALHGKASPSQLYGKNGHAHGAQSTRASFSV